MNIQSNASSPDMPVLKGCYPFRLGTTSYIIHDERVPNARFLAPLLDEVELLFFESRRPDSLPSSQEIDELSAIGRGENLAYNVHLPLDLFLGDADEAVRAHGVAAACKFIDSTTPLQPTCWVVHLDWLRPDGSETQDTEAWVDRLRASLVKILASGVPGTSLVIENLQYPFDLVAPLAPELNLSCCLDIGHMLLVEPAPLDFLQRHFPRATMLHVHGVRQGKDHVSLRYLDTRMARLLCELLQNYTGGLSLEIFGQNDLVESMQQFEEWMPCQHKANKASL